MLQGPHININVVRFIIWWFLKMEVSQNGWFIVVEKPIENGWILDIFVQAPCNIYVSNTLLSDILWGIWQTTAATPASQRVAMLHHHVSLFFSMSVVWRIPMGIDGYRWMEMVVLPDDSSMFAIIFIHVPYMWIFHRVPLWFTWFPSGGANRLRRSSTGTKLYSGLCHVGFPRDLSSRSAARLTCFDHQNGL